MIPEKELNKILKKFNLGKIKSVKPLKTSGNIAYTVQTDKDNFFFRLCPNGPRWRSKNEILAEIELLEYLKKHKFPVSIPVSARNGQKVISCKNHYGYIRKFSKGKEKLNPTPREIKEFGKLIGVFHNLIENYKTKHKREHIWDLNQTKKYFKEDKKAISKSDFKNKKEFIRIIEKELSELNFPADLPSGTIHEDLGKRHAIWDKNKIIAVLDFDRSYYGKLILDLGQAIRGWCFKDDWKKWSSENFKALLQGYESKRKLSQTDKNYLMDAVKFAVLERGISFALRYIYVTHNSKDEKFAWDSATKLINLINQYKKKTPSL